jgi:hypothetical protein
VAIAVLKFGRVNNSCARYPIVEPCLSERVVWIWHLISDFNGCFGEVHCIAVRNLLQERVNAASAIAAPAKVGFVRIADIYVFSREGQLCNILSFKQ